MLFRIALLTVACAALPQAAQAQKVQLLFTPAVLQQTVALKDALKAEKVDSMSVLGLLGASNERKKDFAGSLASYNAVIIVGADALKAASDIQFEVPVILVNAGGRTAARNRIIRVFDGAAPADAIALGPDVSIARVIAPVREIALKGEIVTTVQTLVLVLKTSVAQRQ